MVDMDDETDTLLDEFLAVASGERTDETRERYRRTLHHLRTPGEYEQGAGPGTRLLFRIPDALAEAQAEGSDEEQRETAPSLYGRLVTWLRRHSDAADPDSVCALLEAQARIRDAQEARRRRRYPYVYDWPQVSPYLPLSYDPAGEPPPDEGWAAVISLPPW
jgi:hypothetical protein